MTLSHDIVPHYDEHDFSNFVKIQLLGILVRLSVALNKGQILKHDLMFCEWARSFKLNHYRGSWRCKILPFSLWSLSLLFRDMLIKFKLRLLNSLHSNELCSFNSNIATEGRAVLRRRESSSLSCLSLRSKFSARSEMSFVVWERELVRLCAVLGSVRNQMLIANANFFNVEVVLI